MCPFWSLKVLLVENDDSTRLVVCALLRNCGYEVVAVENGLEAWKILEDLTNQIDLILTEVVTPCLSGIDLLRKIMSHKTCKNIPVIMMSSHDSMSVVSKCLSKGAVHFLVKPIRKNELQHLWQHVWRKCHSSSWTKSAVHAESPKPMSRWDQLADPPHSTCAQVILSRPEAFGNSWMPTTTTRGYEKQDDELYHVVMDKDLELGVSRIPNLQLEDPTGKELNNITSINKEKLSEMDSKNDDEQKEKKQLELNSKKPNGDLRNQAADQMGVITNSIDSTIGDVVFATTNGFFKVSGMKEKAIYENNEIPGLELSLKRQRDTGDSETGLHERNVLRRSDKHSAFSRYASASTANQVPTGNVGSTSLLDNSSEAAKTESVQNLQSNPNGTLLSQRSNGSSNSEMCLTTNSAYIKHTVFSDKPTPKPTVTSLHSSSQPVQNGHKSPQPTMLGKADADVAKTILAQVRGMNQQVQVQQHHHLHHVHNMLQQQLANQDDSLLKTMATAAAPQHGSSNDLSAPIEGNTGDHSLNGSSSGSNHESNGQNESSFVVNGRGTNVESDNGLGAKSGASGGIGCARSGVEENRLAQREAALNKFRQKRKKRCFEKKVRYHSRKKEAEQRPRVRGQFVKQVVLENKHKDPDS